ncbi:MAG: hypothetical protein ACI81T_002825 [Bacteroidia bacterium]
MKNIKSSAYLHFNEIMSVFPIRRVLEDTKKLKLFKATLILPFLYDRHATKVLSFISESKNLEESILKFPNYFASFNDRYMNFLPITVNSISLMKEMKMLDFDKNYIFLKDTNQWKEYENQDLGSKTKRLIENASLLSDIMKNTNEELYKSLRITI